MTVRECLTYYQENYCKSQGSRELHEAVINRFPKLMDIELEALIPKTLLTTLNKAEVKDSTRHTYFTIIQICIRKAIKDHNLQINLNLDGLIKKPKKQHGVTAETAKFLSLEDIKKINATEALGKTQKVAKDLFVLMALSGMAVGDAMAFDPKIHISPDGEWFCYQRKKTGNPCLIPVIEDAKEIIQKYAGRWPLGPVIGTKRNFNHHCRWIGTVVGKRCSSHTARHSFGCICLQWGFSMESVSHFMGHANQQITSEVYAHVTKSKITRELERIPKETLTLK